MLCLTATWGDMHYLFIFHNFCLVSMPWVEYELFVCFSELLLCFTATWGDMHYLGLTGLEVVGRDGEALPVTINMMNGSPRDLHSLPGHENDDRTLDK